MGHSIGTFVQHPEHHQSFEKINKLLAEGKHHTRETAWERRKKGIALGETTMSKTPHPLPEGCGTRFEDFWTQAKRSRKLFEEKKMWGNN